MRRIRFTTHVPIAGTQRNLSWASDIEAFMRLRPVHLLVSMLTIATLAPYAYAEPPAYAGRESPVGVPVTEPLAYSSGVVPFVAEQGTRLAGERVYAGYRFGCGLGIEGAQYQTAARDLASTTDTLSVAGTVSLPLADKVVATAKAGWHVAESNVAVLVKDPGAVAPDRLVGLGVAYQTRENVALTVESQRFGGRPTTSLGAIPSQTYLVGARVQF
jgi:hypothetical protein